MPSWVSDLLPYLAPLVLGPIVYVATSVFATTSRLRKEIAEDSELVAALTGEVADLLRADIENKALRLIASNRFPALTGVDLVLAGAAVGLSVFQFVGALDTRGRSSDSLPLAPPDIFIALVVPPLMTAFLWRELSGRITWRSVDRVDFLEKNGSKAHLSERPYIDMISSGFWSFTGTALTVLPTLVLAVGYATAYDLPEWVGVVVVGVALVAFYIAMQTFAGVQEKRPLLLGDRHRSRETTPPDET